MSDKDITCPGSTTKTCGRKVGNNDGIECPLCENWFHTACQNLNKTMVNYFSAPNASFICLGCNEKELPVLKQGRNVFRDLAKKVQVLEEEVKNNSKRICKLEEISDSRDEDLKATIDKSIDERLELENLKERKKNNLIFANLPESTNINSSLKKAEDMDRVRQIYQELTQQTLQDDDIITCFRLNRPSSDDNKHGSNSTNLKL